MGVSSRRGTKGLIVNREMVPGSLSELTAQPQPKVALAVDPAAVGQNYLISSKAEKRPMFGIKMEPLSYSLVFSLSPPLTPKPTAI